MEGGRKMPEVLCRREEYKRYALNDSASIFTADGKEEPLSLENLSREGACVCGNYPFKRNEFVTVTIKAVSPFFKGLFSKEVRVVWCKKVEPNLWEAGLDLRQLG